MPKKNINQTTNETNGFIYFIYSGLLKQSAVYIKFSNQDPTIHDIPKLKEQYGSNIKARYIKSKNVNVDFSVLQKKLEDKLDVSNLYYNININELLNIMKDITGTKTCHNYKNNTNEENEKEEIDKEENDNNNEENNNEEEEIDNNEIKLKEKLIKKNKKTITKKNSEIVKATK